MPELKAELFKQAKADSWRSVNYLREMVSNWQSYQEDCTQMNLLNWANDLSDGALFLATLDFLDYVNEVGRRQP